MDRFRYIYVFPQTVVFEEYRLCYQNAAARLGQMKVEEASSWTPDRTEWLDPDMVIIFWGGLPEVVPAHRKAKCVLQYVESVGDPKGLVENQRIGLEHHMRRAKEPDLLLVATPSAYDFWFPLCRKVALTPIGYDPEVMGTPDWDRPKAYDIGFCGTPVGRRRWIIPVLRNRFGPRFAEISSFGRSRNAEFDACRAMLYIGHSHDIGIGLRLWQAISTSAALIVEDRDAWPAEIGRHYIGLPPAEEMNPEIFADSLDRALHMPLADISRTAHADLSDYTVERCFREFVIPAILSLDAVPAF